MSSSNAFDLTGLFTIQRQYLADLSAILKGDVTTVEYSKELRQNLNDVYNAYTAAAPASSIALERQNQMKNIVDTEKARLDQKKTGIDNAYSAQQRLIQLNESYREKNMQYINIVIIVIITIVIYLALLIIEQNIPFIPSMLMDALKTLLFMITFIIICVRILQINKRDPMDYQKLLFVAPLDMSNNIIGNTITGNTITGTTASSGCTQSECCSSETEWNNDLQKCVPIEPAADVMNGFTLIGQACGNNNGKKSEGDRLQYIPYTPSEFDSYVRI